LILPKLPLAIQFLGDCSPRYFADVPHSENPAEWEADWYAARIFHMAGFDLAALSCELQTRLGRALYLPFLVGGAGIDGTRAGPIHVHTYFPYFWGVPYLFIICINTLVWQELPDHIKWLVLLHEGYHTIHKT